MLCSIMTKSMLRHTMSTILLWATLLCGCDWLKPSVDKAITEIDRTRADLIQHGGDWQRLLGQLSSDLQRYGDKTIADAATQVKDIVREGAQLSSQEINCRIDIIDSHIDRRLDQIKHMLQRDYHQPVFLPSVCSIAPASIDLAVESLHELSISGAFFFNAEKPTLRILHADKSISPVRGDFVSRVTNYEMRVSLDGLKRDRVIAENASRLLITTAGSSVASEVAVIQVPTCTDHIRNQDESDTDCGGRFCTPCAASLACIADSDCEGAYCSNRKCGFHQVSGTATAKDFGGGLGGSLVQDSTCPTGSVTVGFFSRTGSYTDSVGVICNPLNRNGTVNGSEQYGIRIGDPGGHTDHVSTCPEGRVMRGLGGKTGAYIDQMKGMCSFGQDIARQLPGLSTAISPVVDATGGGNEASAECPSGSAITGLRTRSGAYIDHMWVLCSPIGRVVP